MGLSPALARGGVVFLAGGARGPGVWGPGLPECDVVLVLGGKGGFTRTWGTEGGKGNTSPGETALSPQRKKNTIPTPSSCGGEGWRQIPPIIQPQSQNSKPKAQKLNPQILGLKSTF